MRRNYPLNALRAFEAGARHQSFVKAAEELSVTPAAISHQIKKLEEYLNVTLFNRQAQSLSLSPAGYSLLSGLGDTFEQLDNVINRFVTTYSEGSLTLSIAPAFASKWLVPRLLKFNTMYPEIDVRISSRLELIDFKRDEFDAAIRLGQNFDTSLEAVTLFEEWVTPLCSPSLLKDSKPLTRIKDLNHHVLLHDDSMSFDANAPTWSSWLKAARVDDIDTSRGTHFSHPDHAIQAAIDGSGILLGWRNLAANDISAGRLVQPFELTLPLGSTFRFVYPKSHAYRSKVIKFKDWLLNEISESELFSCKEK